MVPPPPFLHEQRQREGCANLREGIELFETLLDLQAAAVSGDPVHYRHHRLLHHFATNEAFQDLSKLHPVLGISLPEHFHLGQIIGREKQA